ncbi:MAG: DMT family transporter [Bacteroidales bacterium]|nr:DMT family transporter [Bacteroidales bacterium]
MPNTIEKVNKPLATYTLAFFSMFFWGMSFVWIKIVYQYYDPLTTIFIRLVVSSALLILLALLYKIPILPKQKDYKAFLFLAFLEPFIYYIGESFGIQRVSSSVAAIMIATIPIVTPVFAYFKLKERLSLMNFVGIFVSFIGILLMILKPDLSLEYSLIGILLLLLAVFAGAYYTIQLKPLSNKYNPITIIISMNVIGSFYFLPFFLYFEYDKFIQVIPNMELITALAELILFSSIMALVFFVKVVERIGPTKTAAFTNFIPVVTVIAAWFLLPEEIITPKMLTGIFVVTIGVFIAQIKFKRKKTI